MNGCLMTKGFTLVKNNEYIEEWFNSFRGWRLKIYKKDKTYILQDMHGGAIEISASLHFTISSYLAKNIWRQYRARNEREKRGISIKDIVAHCGVALETVMMFESGDQLAKTTVSKLRKSYEKFGVII